MSFETALKQSKMLSKE